MVSTSFRELFLESLNENKDKKFSEFLTTKDPIQEGIFGTLIDKFSSITKKISDSVKSIISNISTIMNKAFSKTKLGETAVISIPLKTLLTEATSKEEIGSMTAKVGYYSEIVTGKRLHEMLTKEGLIVKSTKSNGKVVDYNAEESKYRDSLHEQFKTVLKLDSEIARMENSGEALAEAIFNDLQKEFVEHYEIDLTGDTEKGKSKADIVIYAKMKDIEESTVLISASLKAYISKNINVGGSNVLDKFVRNLAGEDVEVPEELVSLQKHIKTEIQKEVERVNPSTKEEKEKIIKTTKDKARSESKTLIPRMVEILADTLNSTQNNDKLKESFLKILGFDNPDEGFYAAIFSKSKKTSEIISKNNSMFLKQLLENIKNKNSKLIFKKNKSQLVIALEFGGEELTISTVSFTDTGGSGPLMKTNIWVNFKG